MERIKSELGQYIPVHYHFQMLSDKNRMSAFKNAIELIVNPNHRVVDLGSGTGIMSYYAAKQGAKVWGIEKNPTLVSYSRKFIKDNGLDKSIQIIEADAMEWMPEEPVDIVICEMLHSALLREKQVEVVSRFRKEHIKRFQKDLILIPNVTLLGVQPIEQVYDFDGYYAPVPLFQDAYSENKDVKACEEPIVYKIINYNEEIEESIEVDILITLKQDCNINALRFITKNLLALDLNLSKSIDWHNQYLVLPIGKNLKLKTGQEIRIKFNYKVGDSIDKLNDSIEIKIINEN